MTLREFLEAVKGTSDEMLDAPIVVRMETSTSLYHTRMTALGSFSENIYIGPDGLISQSEAEAEYGLQADTTESDFHQEYELIIPCRALVVDLVNLADNPVQDVEKPSYIPHLKMERE